MGVVKESEQLEQAILKTVVYSDLFDYALTPREIAHYLIESVGTQEQVRSVLSLRRWLDGQLVEVDGHVTLRGRESLVQRRREREMASRRLWRAARVFAWFLSRLPFVRMIAVTGTLSMDNCVRQDDVDVLIVAAGGRVWLARAFVILAVYLGRLARTTLCPNYVLSEESLDIGPRSIYVAHEFIQMVPMYGFEVYHRMRAVNSWTTHFLPNAGRSLHIEPECRPGTISRVLKASAEWALSGRVGDWLESAEMRRKIAKLSRRLVFNAGSVILSRDQVKGHFDDHGARITSLYMKSLEYQQVLTTEMDRQAGPPSR